MRARGSFLRALENLLPEGDVAGGEQRVFARVPAKKMRRAGVARMRVATRPNFMEQVRARTFRGAMQVVSDATVLFSGGAEESAELGFEQDFLAFARTHLHDERDGVFRKLAVG